MSHFSHFDLDGLTAERFQELCSAILVNTFSQLVEPHGRPGPDGGIDAKLVGEAISYNDLTTRPISSTASDGGELLWIFQVKHIRRERTGDRQRAIVAALNKEVEAWQRRHPKPTHFYLLTNVNLTVATKKALKKLGKCFPRFECWGEEKLVAFIAGNVGLQNAYFPAYGRLAEEVATMSRAMVGVQGFVRDISKVSTKAKGGKASAVSLTAFSASIRKLVEYEVSFTRINDAFLRQLDLRQDGFESPKGWKVISVASPGNGILVPSKDGEALRVLLDEIQQGNAHLTGWQRYLGEQARKNEQIATFVCHPEKVETIRAATRRLLRVVKGENVAHLKVDQHLKALQARILTDIQGNRLIDATEGLSELVLGRTEYSLSKKQYPAAFYPNMRTIGRRPIFGWDFSALWEAVLESIADVVLSGERPMDIRRQLIHGPFLLCTQAIREQLPRERFQAELATTNVILRVIRRNNDSALLREFMDCVDDLTNAVGDTEHQITTKEDAEWAISISRTVVTYIADLGRLALSKQLELDLETLLGFIQGSTSINFMALTRGQGEEWQKGFELQGTCERELSEVRDEYLFALGTYAWFVDRRATAPDPSRALRVLGQMPMKAIVSVYQKKREIGDGWFSSWFVPEGKRMSWSSTSDHDIRDALQLAILNLPSTAVDYYGLRLLEVKSVCVEFIDQLDALYKTLVVQNHQPRNDMATIGESLESARVFIEDEWKESIRRQSKVSERKLKEIQEAFANKMRERSPEGTLYLVEEGMRGDQKPTHFVGVYSIHDKAWFLEDTGYSYYSVGGMGANWAESILWGREDLVVKEAIGTAGHAAYDADQLDDLLETLKREDGEGQVLLLSPRTIPWRTWAKHIVNEAKAGDEKSSSPRGSRILLGRRDVYTSNFVPKGELLVVPRAGFAWVTPKRLESPRIEMLDPQSVAGQEIAARNPGMDIELKCLIYAREDGTVQARCRNEELRLYKPLASLS